MSFTVQSFQLSSAGTNTDVNVEHKCVLLDTTIF
jgi:hypothetical protein